MRSLDWIMHASEVAFPPQEPSHLARGEDSGTAKGCWGEEGGMGPGVGARRG